MTWKSLLLGFTCLGCHMTFAAPPAHREIPELQKALAREQRAIVSLEEANQKQNQKLKTLQQTLATQLRAAARLAHTPHSTRLLEYHGYLGRSRMALIGDIQQAETARDVLIRKRLLHQATLKKLLLTELRKAPPPPTTLIKTASGAPVYSVAAGKVIFADSLRGFGLMIIISHGNGYMSLYGRNHTLYAKIGDNVRTGQLIGLAGSRTGHDTQGRYFELRHDGTPLPPGQNTFILAQSAHQPAKEGMH